MFTFISIFIFIFVMKMKMRMIVSTSSYHHPIIHTFLMHFSPSLASKHFRVTGELVGCTGFVSTCQPMRLRSRFDCRHVNFPQNMCKPKPKPKPMWQWWQSSTPLVSLCFTRLDSTSTPLTLSSKSCRHPRSWFSIPNELAAIRREKWIGQVPGVPSGFSRFGLDAFHDRLVGTGLLLFWPTYLVPT